MKIKNRWKTVLASLLIGVLGMSLVACQHKGNGKDEKIEKNVSETQTSTVNQEDSESGIPVTSKNLTVVIGEQGYRALPIILDQGWFDEVFASHNIKVEVVKFNSGPEMLEAFTAGQLDVGLLGLQPGISGAANDSGIKTIASFCDAPSAIGLYSLKESGIKTVADLKGKTVGTTIGSNAYSLLLKVLDDEGLSVEKDIDFVNIDFSAATSALESGQVDAVVGFSDMFTLASQADGDIFQLIKDASGYGISESLIAVRDEFAKEHADVIENILLLFEKADEFIANNYEEAVKINADYYELDEAVVKSSFDRYTYDWLDQDTLKKDIDDYIQFMYDNGLITNRLNVDDVVDFSYFEAVIGK